MDNHTLSQWVGNVVSAGAIITSFLGVLPVLGAIIAIVWYAIQIRESKTYQDWRAGRRQRKLAHLRAQVLLLEASLRLEPPTSTLPPTVDPDA